MQDEIVFYTNPMSRGRIVRWMLEEVGHPYRTELLDYAGAMKTPAFLKLNPLGKVPVIQHGAAVVSECAAICAYLADAFPEAQLAPAAGDPARGPYYRWLFLAAGPMEAAVIDRMLGLQIPPERRRMVGYGSLEDVLDATAGALEQAEYLAGDRFTAADLYLGSQLGFGMQFGTVERRPAFERYCARLAERPAAVRAREIDEALIRDAASAAQSA